MSVRKVYLAACDQCEQAVEVPEVGGRGANHPEHWALVTIGVGTSGVFCSPGCASEWVAKNWPNRVAEAKG